MKNTSPDMLKKCICLNIHKYEKIVKFLYGPDVALDLSDGIGYISVATDDEDDKFDDIFERLAEYFGVKEVLSVHCGDEEFNCSAWIEYKE